MKIYPNPIRSTAYVSLPTNMPQGGCLRITSKSGELIEEKTLDSNSYDLIPIDLSEHPNGFYKISLVDELTEVSYDILNLSQN